MTDRIEVFTHSSIRIKGNSTTIYVDPFKIREEFHDADYVFVTHQHYDHFSIEDILKVATADTILVVPESMVDDAMEIERSVKEIVTVRPGENKDIAGLSVEAVHAYNNIKPFHPRRAEWVGYVLTVDDKRIYIAGDTGLTKESREVKCDIAMVPIGGTYTMDAKKAAAYVNELSPKVAIPVHYGSIVGDPSDGEVFASLVKEPVKVEFKILF